MKQGQWCNTVFCQRMRQMLRHVGDYLLTVCCFGHPVVLWRVRKVPGLTSSIENMLLYVCARVGYGSGAVVEIGSFRGRSTIALAWGALRRERITAIDPMPDAHAYAAFCAQVAASGVAERIHHVRQYSHEAAHGYEQPVRLLFIDGSHAYDDVVRDSADWIPKVIDGGLIIFHDYAWEGLMCTEPGVVRAVNELRASGRGLIMECVVDSMIVFSKQVSRSKVPFSWFQTCNRMRVCLRRCCAASVKSS